MKRDDTLLTRRIAVIGLAATGLATARILSERGATVTVYDGKPEADLDVARVAEAKALPNVRLRFGVTEPDWSETDLVVPSPGVPKWARPIAGAVERGIPVWSEIEVAYRIAVAPILAITGTNGKTTTTALVGAICREAGLTTFVAGNIAEDDGKRTPLIVAAVECPADGVIVAEISSFQLEHVHTFKPKVAAWLNLSVDHMDRYASMEEYAQAKAKIFAAQDETDYAILNADDEAVMKHSEGVGKAERVLFSTAHEWEKTLTLSAFVFDGVVHIDTDPLMPVSEMPLIGLHNIANVMVAVEMTTRYMNTLIHAHVDKYGDLEGYDWTRTVPFGTARDAIKKFRGVAHRMEFVADVAGVRYINNSMCTNPAAVEASVSAIETPLVAIVGGIHKGGDLTPMYDSLARKARHVVIIGASKAEIHAGLLAAGMTEAQLTDAETLPDAVKVAASVANNGDTVMLVPGCASFDMFSGFEERGAVFRAAVAGLSAVASPLSPNPFPPADGEKGEFRSRSDSPPSSPSGSPFSPSAGGKGLGDRGEGAGDTNNSEGKTT